MPNDASETDAPETGQEATDKEDVDGHMSRLAIRSDRDGPSPIDEEGKPDTVERRL